MNYFRPIRVNLAVKLAVCVVASTAAFFAFFGYMNLRAERRHSQELVLQSADRITDLILRSTHYEMLHNDREALYNVIQELGSEPGIRRIRIFNKEGRITISTEPGEINTVVDKRAEACYGCHAQSAPLVKLNRPDRARIFTDQRGLPHPSQGAAGAGRSGCQSLAGHGGRPDRAAPGGAGLVPGRGNRAGFAHGGGVHLGGRVPAGEGVDPGDPPRGGWRSRLPSPGPVRR